MKTTGPKTVNAITDEGTEFTVLRCEDCGGDTFHVGVFHSYESEPYAITKGPFAGRALRFQCAKCYPTKETGR